MPARGNGVYSFLNVSAAIVGPGIATTITGAAREGYSVAMDNDKMTFTPGADGSGMHVLVASSAGKITFRLLKTSAANRVLNGMYRYQQSTTASLAGRNTITLTDNNLKDKHVGYGCALIKHPAAGYASETGADQEWVFQATQIEMVLGDGGVTNLVVNG